MVLSPLSKPAAGGMSAASELYRLKASRQRDARTTALSDAAKDHRRAYSAYLRRRGSLAHRRTDQCREPAPGPRCQVYPRNRVPPQRTTADRVDGPRPTWRLGLADRCQERPRSPHSVDPTCRPDPGGSARSRKGRKILKVPSHAPKKALQYARARAARWARSMGRDDLVSARALRLRDFRREAISRCLDTGWTRSTKPARPRWPSSWSCCSAMPTPHEAGDRFVRHSVLTVEPGLLDGNSPLRRRLEPPPRKIANPGGRDGRWRP